MSILAGIPSWMVFVFAMMFIGPTIRLVFGGSRVRAPRKWQLLGREDVDRLEAAIAQRDVVIEDLQQRLSELESRQDFAERMIASRTGETPKEPATIGG
jgi:hypothetical protein